MHAARGSRLLLLIAALAAAVVLGMAGMANFPGSRSEYDRDFGPDVASPVYGSDSADHPLIVYDEGHRNANTMEATYRPWDMLAGKDGYRLRAVREPVSEGLLSGACILAAVTARGPNDANDAPALTDREVAVVRAWVSNGGSLLLVSDHWPFGAAAASQASAFDVQMGQGLVEDPAHGHPVLGPSHIVFTAASGLLADHALTRGRGEAERVETVLSFTGQSMVGPSKAIPVLLLSPTAVEYPPGVPSVERDGADVRVHMQYGEARFAAGRAQALAMDFGRGRIVMLGEAGMLRAQTKGGQTTGMNTAAATTGSSR